MASRIPTTDQLQYWLSTRSAEEIVQLYRSINNHQLKSLVAKELLSSKIVDRGANGQPKKGLNAFVGFRCFYILIPALKPFPMKTLSIIMSKLWKDDPNKSIWALMAKAWSIIRDQIGKSNAPLEQFFRVICPAVNIPSPESYFEDHGYGLNIDNNGNLELFRAGKNSAFPLRPAMVDAALSVEDIIKLVKRNGYASSFNMPEDVPSSTFLGSVAPQNSSWFTAEKLSVKQQQREENRQRTTANVIPQLRLDLLAADSPAPEEDGAGNHVIQDKDMHHTLAFLLTGDYMDEVDTFLSDVTSNAANAALFGNLTNPFANGVNTAAFGAAATMATTMALFNNSTNTTDAASDVLGNTNVHFMNSNQNSFINNEPVTNLASGALDNTNGYFMDNSQNGFISNEPANFNDTSVIHMANTDHNPSTDGFLHEVDDDGFHSEVDQDAALFQHIDFNFH